MSRRKFMWTVSGTAALAATGLTFSHPATAAGRPRRADALRLNVISDVQGDLKDFGDALTDLDGMGGANALVCVGDLVPNGHVEQYEEFFGTLDANPHPETVLSVLGNHEQYNNDPFDTQVQRFLDYTGMSNVYWAQDVAGQPLIAIGTTQPAVNGTSPPFVTLGTEQVSWLDSQISAHPDKNVLVFSHHVLPDSVSGSTGDDAADFYDQDFVDETELLNVLGQYPNVVFFSGHTHWNLTRDDWAVRKIVDGGHPDGFTVVNTGAIETQYGPDGNGGEVPIDGAESQGLLVDVADGGALTITAHDFRRDAAIKTLDVPAPARSSAR